MFHICCTFFFLCTVLKERIYIYFIYPIFIAIRNQLCMHKVAVTLCMCWLILCRLQISRALPSMVTSHKCQLIFSKVSYCWWKKCCTGWCWENLPALAFHENPTWCRILLQSTVCLRAAALPKKIKHCFQIWLPLNQSKTPKWDFFKHSLKLTVRPCSSSNHQFSSASCKLLVSGRVPGANLHLPPWDCFKKALLRCQS